MLLLIPASFDFFIKSFLLTELNARVISSVAMIVGYFFILAYDSVVYNTCKLLLGSLFFVNPFGISIVATLSLKIGLVGFTICFLVKISRSLNLWIYLKLLD